MAGVSKSTERIVNIIVCMGAAIVIFGAWQKITHQPLADFFLTAGLITEAVIFVVYAFLPLPVEKCMQLQKHYLNWQATRIQVTRLLNWTK